MEARTLEADALLLNPPADPARLVAKAREGDFAAFEELYRSHVGHVYAVCFRLARDPALAEELTQQAFVQAWSRLSTFRGKGGFRAWLAKLALNVVLAERRARGRRRTREDEAARDAVYPRPAVPAPSEGATGVDLERSIGELPQGARDVFVLHDVQGYRHDEIAGLLGIAPGTSKAQLHRARRLLREALSR